MIATDSAEVDPDAPADLAASAGAGRGQGSATEIAITAPVISAEGLAALAAAIDFADQALAPATLRAYRGDWQHFCAWCRTAGWPPLPAAPATVAAYLAALAETHTGSALTRRLAVLSRVHRLANQDWPKRIRRSATRCAGFNATMAGRHSKRRHWPSRKFADLRRHVIGRRPGNATALYC
jgi:hypothetical protein